MNKKTILAAALVGLLTCAASEAKADTVWTLNNIELSDGTFLTFQNSLIVAAATDSIVSGSECYGWSCSNAPIRYVVANQSASLATPLPAAVWLVGSGLVGLFNFVMRRLVPA